MSPSKLIIATPNTIEAQIGDVDVSFCGDPPEAALISLYRASVAQQADPAQMLEVIGQLRPILRQLVVPASLAAYDGIDSAGLIGTSVVMAVFTHLSEAYADLLGFQKGLPSPSSTGQPENGPTSPE
jgi:hypothetical protein